MDKPIRVLHVIGIMNRGGAETMIMNLYRHIDRSKVQFDFVETAANRLYSMRKLSALAEEFIDARITMEKSLYLCQVVE